MEYNKLKLLTFVFLLFTSSSYAGLLTINYEASDYFEKQTSYPNDGSAPIYGETQYSPIPLTNFALQYDINFNLAPTDSSYWDTIDHTGYTQEYDQDGKHYSIFKSVFKAELMTPETPFTQELQALMPSKIEPTAIEWYSNPSLYFYSIVITDLTTGDIIEDESAEYFKLKDGFGFRNNLDDFAHDYYLTTWLFLPTVFESAETNHYSVKEFKNILTSRQDLWVRFNEGYVTHEFTSAGGKEIMKGYAGNGVQAFSVPEPSSFAILFLGVIGLNIIRLK